MLRGRAGGRRQEQEGLIQAENLVASLRKHRRGSPRLTRERWADYWRDKETGTQALRGGQGGGGPAHSALCYTST